MSISDEMAHEYKVRYNKNFITFHNTIDIEFWKKLNRRYFGDRLFDRLAIEVATNYWHENG